MTIQILIMLVWALGFIKLIQDDLQPAPRIIDGMYLRPRGGWR